MELLRRAAIPSRRRVARLLEQVRHAAKAAQLLRRRHRFLVGRHGEGEGAGRQV